MADVDIARNPDAHTGIGMVLADERIAEYERNPDDVATRDEHLAEARRR